MSLRQTPFLLLSRPRRKEVGRGWVWGPYRPVLMTPGLTGVDIESFGFQGVFSSVQLFWSPTTELGHGTNASSPRWVSSFGDRTRDGGLVAVLPKRVDLCNQDSPLSSFRGEFLDWNKPCLSFPLSSDSRKTLCHLHSSLTFINSLPTIKVLSSFDVMFVPPWNRLFWSFVCRFFSGGHQPCLELSPEFLSFVKSGFP